jgi:hypothetical protein
MKKQNKRLYKAIIQSTEKAEIERTILAKNAKDARKKLTSSKPWNKTETEDEISRIELDRWKILIAPKEIIK